MTPEPNFIGVDVVVPCEPPPSVSDLYCVYLNDQETFQRTAGAIGLKRSIAVLAARWCARSFPHWNTHQTNAFVDYWFGDEGRLIAHFLAWFRECLAEPAGDPGPASVPGRRQTKSIAPRGEASWKKVARPPS